MKNIIKYVKITAYVAVWIVIIPLIMSGVSILQLFSEKYDVTKSYYNRDYYIKVKSGTNNIEIFKEYMAEKGWTLQTEEKDRLLFANEKGKTKQVSKENIKTMLYE
ncbi:MAG: hypothetical protein K0R69_2402 [Clostridia bacterium]|jgi:hypothetical protein|nr:hypothetical protein [Clostridia bacterium]